MPLIPAPGKQISVMLGPVLCREQVPGQPSYIEETLSQQNKTKQNKTHNNLEGRWVIVGMSGPSFLGPLIILSKDS